jgi:hypothetical protein
MGQLMQQAVGQVLDAQDSLDDPWALMYGLVGVLSILLRDLALARKMTDVNCAAGAARQDMASLISGRLPIELVAEELGEVVDLPLEAGQLL